MSPAYLTRSETDAVRKPVNEASLLPPRCYQDPAFYALEIERVFMRSWLPVGRVEQVANPGDYFTLDLFNEPVLIVRDRAGRLHAHSNVCRHRSRVVVEGAGTCTGLFTCPYHGWSYELDGRLKRATYMDKAQSFDQQSIRLPALKLEVWHGFIFINFDVNARSLLEQLQPLEPIVAPFKLEQMRATPTLHSQAADWNWKVTMENFTEAMHHSVVHGESLEPMFPAGICEYDDADGPYSVFWMPTRDNSPMPELFPYVKDIPRKYQCALGVVNIYPFFHVLFDPSSILWLNWNFKSVELHELSWKLLVPESTLRLGDFGQRCNEYVSKFLIPVVAEDIPASQQTAKGLRSRFARPGRISWMEKSVNQFHNFMLQKLEAD